MSLINSPSRGRVIALESEEERNDEREGTRERKEERKEGRKKDCDPETFS